MALFSQPLLVLLLGRAVLRVGAVDCSDLHATVANAFLTSTAVDLLNGVIRDALPKTIGHCEDVDDSLQPCHESRQFPIQTSGFGYQVQSMYVSGVNNFSLNARLYCGGLVGERWFLKLGMRFTHPVIDTRGHVLFHTIDAPCIAGRKCMWDDEPFHVEVSGRLSCLNSTHLWIEMPRSASSFKMSEDISISVFGVSFDLTDEVQAALRDLLSKLPIACPAGLAWLCGTICSGHKKCDADTGGSCNLFGCSESRGPTTCEAEKCLCAPETCARDGKCECESVDTGGTCNLFGCSGWRGATCQDGRCICEGGKCAAGGICVEVGSKCATRNTGGSCRWLSCAARRGPTVCENGECLCQPGLCAYAGVCMLPTDASQAISRWRSSELWWQTLLFASVAASAAAVLSALVTRAVARRAAAWREVPQPESGAAPLLWAE